MLFFRSNHRFHLVLLPGLAVKHGSYFLELLFLKKEMQKIQMHSNPGDAAAGRKPWNS